jgi:hypothetical protein
MKRAGQWSSTCIPIQGGHESPVCSIQVKGVYSEVETYRITMWKRIMNDILWLVIFLVGWIALQRFVLPRMGVPT